MIGARWTIIRYATVDSTQREAARLVDAGAAHRTVIVAAHQTAGYGRKGDRWHDDPGAALLATIVLRAQSAVGITAYPMALAVSAIAAIARTTGLSAAIKWPNDLTISGRKVAGLLGNARWEGARPVALLLGIGINVRGGREEFAARDLVDATSLVAESGHACDPDSVLDALLATFDTLEASLAAGDAASVICQWRAAVTTLGHIVAVTFRDGMRTRARARDVTDAGDLVLTMTDGETRVVRAGEVAALRHVTQDEAERAVDEK